VWREFVDRAFTVMSTVDRTDPVFTASIDHKTVFVEMRE
jgi:hypothetical protein